MEAGGGALAAGESDLEVGATECMGDRWASALGTAAGDRAGGGRAVALESDRTIGVGAGKEVLAEGAVQPRRRQSCSLRQRCGSGRPSEFQLLIELSLQPVSFGQDLLRGLGREV